MKYLLILLFSLPAFGALNIDSYIQSEDAGDTLKAFKRLLQSPECASGCRIELGCKEYSFTDTLRLCKSIVLTGCGERVTSLRFPTGKTGIELGYGTCTESSLGEGSPGSILEGFRVLSTGAGREAKPTSESPSDFVMIDVKTGTVTLRNIRTEGGRHGIRIDAAVTRTGLNQSIANHWRMDQVTSMNTQHAPIFIDGADSNAGTGTSVSASNGCRYASTYKALAFANPGAFSPQLQQCAGIYDSSFLGNTWVGSHVAGISDDIEVQSYPGYLSQGSNQHTTFIGSYTERNSGCGIISTRSSSLGGIGCMSGTGLIFNDTYASNLTLIKPTITTATLGMDQETGIQTLMTFRFPGAEKVSYMSWVYDQRHRADGITPSYAPGHDSLTLKADGLNSRTIQKWSLLP